MVEHAFTDDEIRQIIDVINRTKHTKYIGARYVPIFGRVNEDSIQWDNSAPYEPLTVVLHQGNSYTSRQHVPAGVEITNEQYWANTGNYNAQVEQYRQETKTVAQNAESSINEVRRDYLKKTDAQDTYATKTELNDTKTTIENNANSKFVSKTVYDTAIASKADKTSVYTKTETNMLVRQRKIVVFGDSWTHLYNDFIPKTIASNIGGTLVKNYGIDGAQIGSANSSDTHYQAETAKADTSIDKEAVTDVVFLATVNNAGGAKITDNYLDRFTELHGIFPHARHWFIQNSKMSLNSDAAALDSWYFPLQALASRAGWAVATYSPLWLLDSNYLNYWTGVNWAQRHPNENGCRAFANRAAAFLSGRDYKPHMTVPFTVDSDFAAKLSLAEFTINDRAFVLDGFDLKIRATIVGRSDTTHLPDIGDITVGTIPKCFAPSDLQFYFPVLQIASTQGWSDYHMKPAGVFRIRDDGKVNIDSAAFRDNKGFITAFGSASLY